MWKYSRRSLYILTRFAHLCLLKLAWFFKSLLSCSMQSPLLESFILPWSIYYKQFFFKSITICWSICTRCKVFIIFASISFCYILAKLPGLILESLRIYFRLGRRLRLRFCSRVRTSTLTGYTAKLCILLIILFWVALGISSVGGGWNLPELKSLKTLEMLGRSTLECLTSIS